MRWLSNILLIVLTLNSFRAGASTVLNMSFDADTPPTVVDSSGNGNNGTINGSISATNDSLSATAYDFPGGSSYIQVADSESLDCSSGVTMSAWIKPVGLDEYPNVTYLEIISKSGAYSFAIRGSGNMVFSVTGVLSNWATSLQNNHLLFDGAWHHVAASYNGSTMAIYIDGKLNSSTAATGTISASANVLKIGNNFLGKMDEVRVSNAGVDAAGARSLWLSYGTPRLPRSYYISSSLGIDTNDGLSSGTPWQTLSTIYARQNRPYQFIGGDSILLKCGDTWSGQLATLYLDGTVGTPIVFGDYGTGDTPKIYGDGRGLTWTAVPGYTGVYEAALGAGHGVSRIYEGSTALGASPDYTASANWKTLAVGRWAYPYYMSDRIWIRTLDDLEPASMTVFRNAIDIYHSSCLLVQSMAIESFASGRVQSCVSVTLSNVVSTYSIFSSFYNYFTTNCIYDGVTVNMSGESGIYLLSGLSNVVRNCTVNGVDTNINGFPNGGGDRGGIGSYEGNANIIEHCQLLNPTGNMSGAWDVYYENDTLFRWNYAESCPGFYPHGNNNVVFGNILNGNNLANGGGVGFCPADHAIHNSMGYGRAGAATNNFMLNNTFWNIKGGVLIYPGGIFRNNIVYGNGALVDCRKSDIGNGVEFGVSDYNCFYDLAPYSANPRFNIWEPSWPGGSQTLYTGFSNYQTASGQDAHSVYADPKFVSASPLLAADFRLQSDSPAINSGYAVGAGIDYGGNPVPYGGGYDMGAWEYGSTPYRFNFWQYRTGP